MVTSREHFLFDGAELHLIDGHEGWEFDDAEGLRENHCRDGVCMNERERHPEGHRPRVDYRRSCISSYRGVWLCSMKQDGLIIVLLRNNLALSRECLNPSKRRRCP